MTITSPRRAIQPPETVAETPAEQDPRSTTNDPATKVNTSDAPNSRPALSGATPKMAPLGGLNSPAANLVSTPLGVAPQDSTSPATNKAATPSPGSSRGTKTAGRRVPSDAHGTDAAGFNSRSTSQAAASIQGPSSETSDPAAEALPAPVGETLLDPALSLAADVLDDIERVRIANENRIRQLTRTGEDEDGEERGFGLDPDHPDVMRIAVLVHALQGLEHDATLELQRKVRKHPLGAWMKAQRGIGEKQGARLLAAIGDPYINSAKGQPRTVSALWAYCGLHVLPGGHLATEDQMTHAAGDQRGGTDQERVDAHNGCVGVAAKRRKGQRANWSSKAKMRAYLIAESCMKTGRSPQCRDGHASADALAPSAVPACACSPYRLVYEHRRAHTAVTHPDWTDGHSHNDALRVVSKEALKQLWRAAREWHLANGEAAA